MSSPKHLAERFGVHSRKTWAVGAGALLVLAGATFAVGASPLFHVKTIQVQGYEELERGEVLRAARLDPDTNLITLSPGTVEDRLTEQPWILDAEVERRFPSSLTITITERTPSIAVRRGNAYAVVASDGVTVEESTRDPRLPFAKGAKPGPVGESSPAIMGAAAVAAAWDATVLAEDPAISVATDGTVTVELRRGIVVDYGMPSDPVQKGRALAGVLAWADEHRERLASIDLRVPGAPAAKLDNGKEHTVPEEDAADTSRTGNTSDEEPGGGSENDVHNRDRSGDESPTPTL